MTANLTLKFLQNQLSPVGLTSFFAFVVVYVFEEPSKLFCIIEQLVVYFLSVRRQLIPCCHFVIQQVASLHRVVDRIVQFVHLQLVILHQMVIGPFGKEQRRKKQSVNNRGIAPQSSIFQVMIDNVMSANRIAF